MQEGPASRDHALDALRAAMMLLGIVQHCAANYTQAPLGWAWPYQDPRRTVVFDLLVSFIRVFRMPVFFLIAGFFGALLYQRHGLVGLARNRAQRILLPLVLSWAGIVPLVGIAHLFSVRQLGGDLPWQQVSNETLLELPTLGHLWFLFDLLMFYAAALVVAPLARRAPARLWQRVDAVFGRVVASTWGAILLGGVTTLTLIPMTEPAIDRSTAVLRPWRLLVAHGVFFASGWLLFRRRDVVPSFGARWRPALGSGLSATAVYLCLLTARPIADRALCHLATVFVAGTSSWLLLFGLLGLFVRYLDRPRPVVRYFSDASYWVYLVHVVPAALIPGLLAHSTLPAAVKCGVVLGSTLLLAVLPYHYLVRQTVIGELLNGRRHPRSLPPHEWAASDAAA